ncbi:hypothetical protein HDU93_002894 [Gonapodya sp. JEL0774]|nr:hypothetical protein HDU93_002894 [Gonapodya sp. JEL0774]
MLSSTEFWKIEAASPSLPLFNKNLGFVTSVEDGRKIIERFGRNWAKSFPPTSEEDQADEKTGSDAVSGGPVVDENEDEHLRIFRRDAERTFKAKVNQDQQISVLSHYVKTYGDYHQGLSFVVSAIMLAADGSATESRDEAATLNTRKQLALVRRIITELAENTEKYAMKEAWKSEAVISAVDGYVLTEILKKYRPQLSAQLERNGILPEIWFQRIRCGLCVHVLPLSSLYPFLDNFLIFGQPFLRKFTLALLALLEPRIAKAGNNTSKILEIIHLDLEAMGLSKMELGEAVSAKVKITEFEEFCQSVVTAAAASCRKNAGTATEAAPAAIAHSENVATEFIPSPEAEDPLAVLLSAADALDWAAESARQYDLRLRARMERAKAAAATKDELEDDVDDDDEDELSDDSETEEERLARLMGGVAIKE